MIIQKGGETDDCLKYQIPVSGVQTMLVRDQDQDKEILKYQIPVSGVQTGVASTGHVREASDLKYQIPVSGVQTYMALLTLVQYKA